MASLNRYWTSEFAEGEDEVPSPGGSGVSKMGDKRRNKDSENNQVKKRKKAEGKIDGMTLTQHKRMLGDQVKDKIMIAGRKVNWHIKALCQVTTRMSS
jgi:hypothetical protein